MIRLCTLRLCSVFLMLFVPTAVIVVSLHGKYTRPKIERNSIPAEHKRMLSESRFKRISLDAVAAHEEIKFWERQLMEHALFLYLMLQDDGSNGAQMLKKEAKEIYDAWGEFIREHEQAEKGAARKHRLLMNKVLPLARRLLSLKIRIYERISAGIWMGFIYPAFIDHIIEEINYFIDSLNGMKRSIFTEIVYWNEINAEHAELLAHLLNPSEQSIKEALLKSSQELILIPRNEEEMLIALSCKLTESLDSIQKEAASLLDKGMLQSTIHPLLLEHIVRENERSVRYLKKLNDALKQIPVSLI